MRIKVTATSMNRAKTLQKRLEKAGWRTQMYLVRQVAKRADKYTPFKTGNLKDTVQINHDNLRYRMPYAIYQWHGRGMVNYSNNESGLRGSHWVDRMYIAEQREIKRDVKKHLLEGLKK